MSHLSPPLKKRKIQFNSDDFWKKQKANFETQIQEKQDSMNGKQKKTPNVYHVYDPVQTQNFLITRFVIQSVANENKFCYLDFEVENSDLNTDFAPQFNKIKSNCDIQIDIEGEFITELKPRPRQTSTIKVYLRESSKLNIMVLSQNNENAEEDEKYLVNNSNVDPFHLFSIESLASSYKVKAKQSINFIGLLSKINLIGQKYVLIFHSLKNTADGTEQSRGISVSFKEKPDIEAHQFAVVLGVQISYEARTGRYFAWGSQCSIIVISEGSPFYNHFEDCNKNDMILKGLKNPLVAVPVTWLERQLISDLSTLATLRQKRMYRLGGGRIVGVSNNALALHCVYGGKRIRNIQADRCVDGHLVEDCKILRFAYASNVTVEDGNGVKVVMKPHKELTNEICGQTQQEIVNDCNSRYPNEPFNWSFKTFLEILCGQSDRVWVDFFIADDMIKARRFFISQVHCGEINDPSFIQPYKIPPK